MRIRDQGTDQSESEECLSAISEEILSSEAFNKVSVSVVSAIQAATNEIICTLAKQSNQRNHEADTCATKPFELVHTDLAGPIDPIAKDGFRYVIIFTDDYSGCLFTYFQLVVNQRLVDEMFKLGISVSYN